MSRNLLIISILLVVVVGLALAELILGSVHVPFSQVWAILCGGEGDKASYSTIVLDSRLPRTLTGILAGAGLAMSGLLMQTYFRNPLAGPSVLGISSGASLGVALLVMLAGGTGVLYKLAGIGGYLAVALAAGLGAFAALALILWVARRMSSAVTLLIFGLMLGYLTSAIIIVLQKGATQGSLQAFVFWGMGSFANTIGTGLAVLSSAVGIGLLTVLTFARSLNAMLLGRDYATSMGVNVKRVEVLLLLSTGLLAGVVTAFCGPIAFLGLAVPHLARGVMKSSDHLWLIPSVLLVGMALALGCDLISRVPLAHGHIPLNAVTSIVGAPIILWIIVRNKRLGEMV